MIPDLPFLFSIAALSGSLAGLAGLVGGLRRGADFRPIDRFRLREIVEFAFANTLLALSTVPLANLLGSVEAAVRIVAFAAIAYVLAVTVVLFRRLRAVEIPMTRWAVVAGILDLLILGAGMAALVSGAIAALQVLLVLLLARPMMAFVFVLTSFDQSDSGADGG